MDKIEPTDQRATSSPGDSSPRISQSKRDYRVPELVHYGNVKELTAGTKLGLNDISLNSSIV
jgi:hypothetical protein